MGNGIDVKDAKPDVGTNPEEPRYIPKVREWGVSEERVEATGICDTCMRKYDDPPYSSCYVARNGEINGLKLGVDIVLLRCHVSNYRGENLYRPITLE